MPPLFAGADHIYVVTLPQRRANVRKVLGGQLGYAEGRDYTLVNAVMAATLNLGDLHRSRDVTVTYTTRGKVACHMSHRRAMQMAIDDGHATALIMEDDVKLAGTPETASRNALVVRAEADAHGWDMIYLGYCYNKCKKSVRLGPNTMQGNRPLCRHAIVYTRNALLQLTPSLWPMYNSGDVMLAQESRKLGLVSVLPMKQLVLQDVGTFGTTLGNVDSKPPCTLVSPAYLMQYPCSITCVFLITVLVAVLLGVLVIDPAVQRHRAQ